MQDAFYTELIDLETAGRHWIGQKPISLVGGNDHPISVVRIAENFGRFGNNFYQILNALVIASRLGCHSLILPPSGPTLETRIDPFGSVRLLNGTDLPLSATALEGGFYAPFGFEHMFNRVSTAEWVAMIEYLAQSVYANITMMPAPTSTLAVHLRGGDIFEPGPTAHPWYVQPPASFYVTALRHALRQNTYDSIVLVSQDEVNPARSKIIEFLDTQPLPYHFASQEMLLDLRSLGRASCMIASSSTFCEVAALLSSNLRHYYSFRRHGSQDVFKPFAQSRVDQLLTGKGVKHVLVDDITYSYTGDRDWKALPEQLQAIRDFPEHNLRLFWSNA